MSAPSRYVVSPGYDWAFFLLPPTVAMWVGFMVSGTAFTERAFGFLGGETTMAQLALGTIVHAHLVAVVFRSHVNGNIFRLYPYRFVLIPALLWLALMGSPWIAVTATVVATFWDVWHSGAQTFGFARIYDRNAGGEPERTRRLDKWMNQLLYAGPILAGVTLADHIHVFDDYEALGTALFASVPARVEGAQRYLTHAVVGLGGLLVAYYVLAHVRLYRAGHRFSPLKIFLVTTTGLCSIFAWGFNSWGEAFFIMNLFHAVQYLALVWATERGRVMQVLRVDRVRVGKPIAAAVFFGTIGVYGFAAQTVSAELTSLWALTMVVSLMHFWYDGFVWSVRKRQV